MYYCIFCHGIKLKSKRCLVEEYFCMLLFISFSRRRICSNRTGKKKTAGSLFFAQNINFSIFVTRTHYLNWKTWHFSLSCACWIHFSFLFCSSLSLSTLHASFPSVCQDWSHLHEWDTCKERKKGDRKSLKRDRECVCARFRVVETTMSHYLSQSVKLL